MNIRLASIDDAQEICDFFSKATTYQRDIPFWTWLHKQWSLQDSISIIAEDKGKVIGNYSIIIQKVIIKDAVFLVGLGLHAIVSPEYRKQVSIMDLSSIAYNEAKTRGLKFIYGFPNKNYRLIQEKLERWERVDLFNAMQLSQKDAQINTDSIASFSLQKITDFNHQEFFVLAKLIEKNCSSQKCEIYKDSKYYLNRYHNHPQTNYECFFIKNDSEFRGFIVFKQFEDTQTNTKHAHIVDFVKTESIDNKSLLLLFIRHYRTTADTFTLWRINSEFEEVLKENGFRPSGFDTFFGLKFLDNEFETLYKDFLTDFNSWNLFMGDSDVF